MKFRILCVTTICFFPFLLQTAEAQQREKQLPSATEVTLEAKIVSAVQPDSVKILRQFGDHKAPEGQKWLYLRVQIDVPKEETWLLVKSIKVIDESSRAYPALGMAIGKPIGKDDLFVLFDSDPVGLAQLDDKDGIIFILGYMKDDLGILLSKKQQVETRLLFAVPVAVKRLLLQIGEGTKMLVPVR